MNQTRKPTFTLEEFASLVSQIVDIWKRHSRDTKYIIIHEDDTLSFDYDKANDELTESMDGVFYDMLHSTNKTQERNDIYKVLYASITQISELEYNENILSGSMEDIKNYLVRQNLIQQLLEVLVEEPRTYKTRS